MAVDTAEKRRASVSFGLSQLASTLIPTGSSSAFRRGSSLGGYYQTPSSSSDVPSNGWIAESRSRVWIAGGSR